MKKRIVMIFIGLTTLAHSQMAVIDAGVNTTLATQLTTSSNQLLQLEKSYEALKSAADKVDKVGSTVKSVSSLGEIMSLQKEAIQNVNMIMNKSKKTNINSATLKRLSAILTTISISVTGVTKMLSNGFFSMTDKERVDYFKETKSKILLNVVRTRVIANQYK